VAPDIPVLNDEFVGELVAVVGRVCYCVLEVVVCCRLACSTWHTEWWMCRWASGSSQVWYYVLLASHEVLLISLLVVLHKALSHLPQFLSSYLEAIILAVCTWTMLTCVIRHTACTQICDDCQQWRQSELLMLCCVWQLCVVCTHCIGAARCCRGSMVCVSVCLLVALRALQKRMNQPYGIRTWVGYMY